MFTAAVALPAPVALSLGVASGVDAPLSNFRTVLIVVPRPMSDRCLRRRVAAAAGEEHSADDQKRRANITSFNCTEAKYPELELELIQTPNGTETNAAGRCIRACESKSEES